MFFSRIRPARTAGDATLRAPIHSARCTCGACQYPRRVRNELRHFNRVRRLQEAAWIITLSGFLGGFYLATLLHLPEILATFGWAR